MSQQLPISIVEFHYSSGDDLLCILDDVGVDSRVMIIVDSTITNPNALSSKLATQYNYAIKSSHTLNSATPWFADRACTVQLCDTKLFLINDITTAKLLFKFAKHVRNNFEYFRTLYGISSGIVSDSLALSIASHTFVGNSFLDFPVGSVVCANHPHIHNDKLYIRNLGISCPSANTVVLTPAIQ